MRSLYELREWLTLEETAEHLSSVLKSKVEIKDLYRLVLDEHLTLSIHIINSAYARVEEIDSDKASMNFSQLLYDGLITFSDDEVSSIDGVWDVLVFAGAVAELENVFQHAINGPSSQRYGLVGAFLRQGNLIADVLTTSKSHIKALTPLWEVKNPKYSKEHFYAGYLNDVKGTRVVRTNEINRFLQTLEVSPSTQNKTTPLKDRERKNLLAIIAGLLKMAETSPVDRDITSQLERVTLKIGHSVSRDTIRKALKRIADDFEN